MSVNEKRTDDLAPSLREFLNGYNVFYANSGFIVQITRGAGGVWNTPVGAPFDRMRIAIDTPAGDRPVMRAFVVHSPNLGVGAALRVNIENPLPGMHSSWTVCSHEQAMRRFVDWASAVLEKAKETE